ncbi:hypothetical protein F4553_003104 [Allocatelliglobosispora scoriae]|uniref:Uncharacterized protein n=1 Tax=Allocatelliglobosispora scoriae TaxID=643052 RepID=A0A841BPV9_9ACTN|nr:hypothetical protein [Allocatelliglobosispora scoriae]MBB5869725.1 hypothetical protein [Allocatelliglobosispora scoriae]
MSVVYHRLYFSCPACAASGQRAGPPTYWYHSDCDGPLDIGSDATVRCSRCYFASHIRHWRYSCANHQGDYRSTTSSHFASSMSMSAALLAAGGRSWLISILGNLSDW